MRGFTVRGCEVGALNEKGARSRLCEGACIQVVVAVVFEGVGVVVKKRVGWWRALEYQSSSCDARGRGKTDPLPVSE